MTPDEIIVEFKHDRLSSKEALDLIGQKMEKLRKAGKPFEHLNKHVNTVLGLNEEPDPENKALASAWERNKRRGKIANA